MEQSVDVLEQPMLIDEAQQIADVLVRAQEIIEAEALKAEQEAHANIANALGLEDTASDSPADLVDANIESKNTVVSPSVVEKALPVGENSKEATTTRLGRTAIEKILVGADDRLIVITGPCSIHSAEEAIEYAEKVKGWREQYGENLEIVMRLYFEKPRSEDGWKGLVYDPRLDGSENVNLGLVLARMIAMRVTGTGVPVAMERLNALTPQYLNGLVSYDAIGARNSTDQKAREYGSGTSSAVGFKNSPDGNVDDAISAVVTARNAHTFLGIQRSGMPAEVKTKGNKLAHVILRGGKDGPNYAPKYIAETAEKLAAKSRKLGRQLLRALLIDASHGNSGKVAANQQLVVDSVSEQVGTGEDIIKGVMLESNLRGGKQDLGDGTNLEVGVSVTDDCIGLEETEILLKSLSDAVVKRRTLSTVN